MLECWLSSSTVRHFAISQWSQMDNCLQLHVFKEIYGRIICLFRLKSQFTIKMKTFLNFDIKLWNFPL